MPELALVPPPPRPQLLRQLRECLADFVPGLRILAERVMGAESAIDFVGLEPEGRVVLVLVGEEGSDLELVARALAQRAWVEARLGDWLQLAPGLGIRPEAGARALLLCPSYLPETLTAAAVLGPDALWLARYRCLRNGAGLESLLERVIGPEESLAAAAADPEPGPASFRTGLSDFDLGLSPDELAEFE